MLHVYQYANSVHMCFMQVEPCANLSLVKRMSTKGKKVDNYAIYVMSVAFFSFFR